MNFRPLKMVLPLAALLVTAWTNLPAETVGYWDFNDGSLARSQGTSGSMHLTMASVSVDSYVAYPNAGTTLNAQPDVPAGRALEFFDLLSIVENGSITITGLDFTGLSDVAFSFAIRRNTIGALLQSFTIETNTGSGWETFGTFAEPTSTYSVRNIDLSSIEALNGASGIGLRIHFTEMANLVDTLEFDNVTVTALPEPSTYALFALAAAFLAFRVLRRRQFAKP